MKKQKMPSGTDGMTKEEIEARAKVRTDAQYALPKYHCQKHRTHVKSYCRGMCIDHECEKLNNK